MLKRRLRFWKAEVDPGNAIAYISLSARDMRHPRRVVEHLVGLEVELL